MTARHQTTTRLDKWGMNTIAKQVISPILLAWLMFALAQTTDWLWGWVFQMVHIAAWVMMTVVLIRHNPELLNVRGRRQPHDKPWDFVIVSIYGITWILMLVVGALDVRYGWTAPIAPAWHVLGNGLILAGFGLMTWAMAVNRSFEVIVRIQTDRNHTVVKRGPYRYVRHPGYTGVILAFYFGMPLALGSLPAAFIAVVGLATMIVRTLLEDRTLQMELPGYEAFTHETRYRLIPGVW